MSQRSADELNAKIDRCFSNSLRKIVGGVAIGVIASVVLFKGKKFPIWFGAGIGIGQGWSNCRHDLQQLSLLHDQVIKQRTDVSGKPIFTMNITDPIQKVFQ